MYTGGWNVLIRGNFQKRSNLNGNEYFRLNRQSGKSVVLETSSVGEIASDAFWRESRSRVIRGIYGRTLRMQQEYSALRFWALFLAHQREQIADLRRGLKQGFCLGHRRVRGHYEIINYPLVEIPVRQQGPVPFHSLMPSRTFVGEPLANRWRFPATDVLMPQFIGANAKQM